VRPSQDAHISHVSNRFINKDYVKSERIPWNPDCGTACLTSRDNHLSFWNSVSSSAYHDRHTAAATHAALEAAVTTENDSCKYSQEPTPGARVEDLYAVCGQAQKSINWTRNPERLIEMLMSRDAMRPNRNGVSGIEVGDRETLRRLRRQAHLLVCKPAVWVCATWAVQKFGQYQSIASAGRHGSISEGNINSNIRYDRKCLVNVAC